MLFLVISSFQFQVFLVYNSKNENIFIIISNQESEKNICQLFTFCNTKKKRKKTTTTSFKYISESQTMQLGRIPMARCRIPWQMCLGFSFFSFFTVTLLLLYTKACELLNLTTATSLTSQIPRTTFMSCCCNDSRCIFLSSLLHYCEFSFTRFLILSL